MKYPRFLFVSMLMAGFYVLPAEAQVTNADTARVDRLERDIMLLQKQLARSGVKIDTSAASGGGIESGADLELRLAAMEEALRDMRGKLEENDFAVRKVTENFEKFQKDTEFRFSELSAGNAAAPVENDAETSTVTEETDTTERKPLASTPSDTPAEDVSSDGLTTAGDGVLRAPDPNAPDTENFDTPRDLYNYAFRLLNQTRYEAAASAFATFAKKYPKDPLIGNAYYWQGETFYIRRDYVNAADAFRQGFEALPSGPKAPDNLLKLAMSLDALDRSKEACVVLQQITSKFKKTSINIVDKAGREQKRIGCK